MQIEKLIAQVGPEWANLLKPFMVEDTTGVCPYQVIASYLKQQKEAGITFLPEGGKVYRAFRETPLKQVRVVFLSQDPYFKAGYATGLAMGNENQTKLAPTLAKLFDGVEQDQNNGLDLDKDLRDPSLVQWAQQGVLMLNAALTVEEGKAGSHQDIWKPFTQFLIKAIQEVTRDLVWIVLGSPAKELVKDVNVFRNFVYTAEHPAAAARDGNRPWKHNNVFSKANLAITLNNLGKPIKW